MFSFVSRAVGVTDWARRGGGDGDGDGVPGGGPPPPYPAVTAVAEVTAATADAAAAAANLSGLPVTAVWVALGTKMTRERAGVSEAAPPCSSPGARCAGSGGGRLSRRHPWQ